MIEITIVVPVYKVEPYLRRCIDSILSQTINNFEVILVDDGSPDKSGEICDEYVKMNSDFHVIHQGNSGLSSARNAGIDWAMTYSNSSMITFIDSDDWIHPLYLKALYEGTCKYNTDIAICGHKRCFEESLPTITEITSTKWNPRDYYKKDFVNATVAWGKLFRKELFEGIRFPLGRIHEDEFTIYKMLFASPYVAIIEQPLYAYFQNNEGIMRRPWSPKRMDALLAYEEQMEYFTKKGMLDISELVFSRYFSLTKETQKLIEDCPTISEKEKKTHEKTLINQRRRILIKYHRYKWAAYRKSSEIKALYASAFQTIKIGRDIWGKIKPLLIRRSDIKGD